jgi:hypothetical protein
MEVGNNQKPWEAAGSDGSTKISPTITKIAPGCHASHLGTLYITVAAEPFTAWTTRAGKARPGYAVAAMAQTSGGKHMR